MVTVRTYTDRESLRPANRQNRQANVNADMFGAGIGRSLQQVAQGVQDIGEAVGYRNEIVATNDARDAGYAYREAIRQVMYSPEGGFLMTEGRAAYGEGSREAVMARLEAQAAEIAGGLSPRAATLFRAEADRLNQGVLDQTIRHAASQFRSASSGGGGGGRRTNGRSYADVALDDARPHAGSPDIFWAEVAAGEENIRADAALEGWDEEKLEGRLYEYRSRAHQTVAEELVHTQGPLTAQNYLDDNREAIYPPAYSEMREGLAPAVEHQSAVDWIESQNTSIPGAPPSPFLPPEMQEEEQVWTSDSGPELDTTTSSQSPTVPTETVGPRVTNDEFVQFARENEIEFAAGLSDEEIAAARGTDLATERAATASRQDAITQGLRTLGQAATPTNIAIYAEYGPEAAARILGGVARRDGHNIRMSELLGPDAPPSTYGLSATAAYRRMERLANPVQTGTAGSVVNPEGMLARALEIEDPVLRENVMREIQLRREVAQAEASFAAQAALEAGYEYIDQGRSPDDIPMQLQREIGVAGMNEIRSVYGNARMGVNVTDPDFMIELEDLMNGDEAAQRRFAEMDLNESRSLLAEADRRSLVELQRQMQQQFETIDTQGYSAVIMTPEVIDSADNVAQEMFSAMAGVNPRAESTDPAIRQQFIRFRQQFRHQMEQDVNRLGRNLTITEQENLAQILATPATYNYNRNGNRGDVGIIADAGSVRGGIEPLVTPLMIPNADYERIEADFQQRWDRPVTEDEVVEQYENELLLSVGLEPNVEFHEIPGAAREEVIALLQESGIPNPSRGDIVATYIEVGLQTALARRREQ